LAYIGHKSIAIFKRAFIKIYSPQSRRERRAFGFFCFSLRRRKAKRLNPSGNKMPVLVPCNQGIDFFVVSAAQAAECFSIAGVPVPHQAGSAAMEKLLFSASSAFPVKFTIVKSKAHFTGVTRAKPRFAGQARR